MDLSKQSNENKLQLCRWYFKVGFAALPFAWTVNAIWFFSEAFRRPEFAEQKQIQKYVVYSAIGATLWLILLVSWVITFQTHRVSWGAFADDISFIVPFGE